MTTLTNGAILLAARDLDVTCGECRMRAIPARVLGIVERIVEEREQVQLRRLAAVVAFRCQTPECEIGIGPGVWCEVPL